MSKNALKNSDDFLMIVPCAILQAYPGGNQPAAKPRHMADGLHRLSVGDLGMIRG